MGDISTLYKANKAESYELGKGDWFLICGSEDYTIFKVGDLWTVDTLADFVWQAITSRHGRISKDNARDVAAGIIAWAGDDPVVLASEFEPYRTVLKNLGLNIKGWRYKQTGDRWADMKHVDENGQEIYTEEERHQQRLEFEKAVESQRKFNKVLDGVFGLLTNHTKTE